MDPIATYTERLIQVRRVFTLYQDRVEVDASWLPRGKYHSTIKLNTLKPEHRQLKIRYRLFGYAKWVFAIGALVFAMAVYPTKATYVPPLGWLGAAAALLGLLLVALTYQKVTFIRFDPVSGKGGLDVARAGPDKDNFETFVRQISREIRRQRAKG